MRSAGASQLGDDLLDLLLHPPVSLTEAADVLDAYPLDLVSERDDHAVLVGCLVVEGAARRVEIFGPEPGETVR